MALSVREVIDDRERVVEGLIVDRGPDLAERVGEIDAGVVSVGGIQVTRCVVFGARPGEGVEQIEAVAGAMFKLGLQRVVVKQAGGQGFFDGGEGLDRPALGQGEAAGGGGGVTGGGDRVRCGLVEVGKGLKLDPVGADVGDLKGGGRAYLSLHGQVVGLHVSRGEIFGNIASLRRKVAGRRDVGGVGKVGGVPLVAGAEAGSGIGRVEGYRGLGGGAGRKCGGFAD